MVPGPQTRVLPNILVTGTPGVGKSSLCKSVSEAMNFKWLDVSKLANENQFLEEYDETYRTPVLDEDKVLDYMEPIMAEGGVIVDYHSSELFPERWFDIVFVLRTNNTILYDRLTERGYTGTKLKDNVSCEIFQVPLEEALNSYSPSIVVELESNNVEEMDNNIIMLIAWIQLRVEQKLDI